MSLIIGKHAAGKMIERYLDELDVRRTIAFPDEKEQQGDVMVSKKTMGMKHVTVVWHLDERGNYIVRTII